MSKADTDTLNLVPDPKTVDDLKQSAEKINTDSINLEEEIESPVHRKSYDIGRRSSIRPMSLQEIKIQKMDPTEKFWMIFSISTAIFAIVCFYFVYAFQTSELTADIEKYPMYDLGTIAGLCAVITVIRLVMQKTLHSCIKRNLATKKKESAKKLALRTDIYIGWLYETIYYIIVVITAMSLLGKEEFYPNIFGGQGNCKDAFFGYPNVPQIAGLRELYILQAAEHTQIFFQWVFFEKSAPKYWEYVLHHLLAMVLIFFSYYMNFIVMGTLVLIAHDLSDTVIFSTRMYSDFKDKKGLIQTIMGLTMVIVFIYCR